MPQAGDNKYLSHLTGFRAIAAYLVLITHSMQSAFSYGDHASSPTIYVTCLANLGMSIFFVLSGFVITYTYYDYFRELPWWKATKHFMVARFARLYPLYIICLLADYKQCKWFLFRATWPLRISFLTLTQSWWHVEGAQFSGAWSVSTEWFFYLCFALWMLKGTKERSGTNAMNRALITFTGILFVLVLLFIARDRVTAFLLFMLNGAGDAWSWWFPYISPYVRIFEFIAGACAARMFMVTRHEPPLPASRRRADILCIVSILFIIMLTMYNFMLGVRTNPEYGWLIPDNLFVFLSLNFGYAPFLATIFYVCSRYPNHISRWCSVPLMVLAGEISYSLYLLQFEIIHLHVLSEPVAQSASAVAYVFSVLKAMLYILLTTAAAYYSYNYIEVPCRRYIRKRFG